MAKKKLEKTITNNKALEDLKAKMEKQFGKGVIISGDSVKEYDVISTGSLRFDKITNCLGIPRGKLVEMFGPESSGKSTLALHIIAEFQKKGLTCLLSDFEYSFDAEYAAQIGVNVDDLIISQPDTMEDGYNIIYEYIKSGEIGLVVVDSHTAMVPKQRLEGEIGDAKMAPEARVNSDALKKIKPELQKHNVCMLGISQLRSNIGGMGAGDVPTGGNAWKFYSDMRIKIYKQLDRPKETNLTTIEIVKNKCAKPYGKGMVPIAWGIGIDKMSELVDISSELGIIKKSGSWYSYNEAKLGQGSENVKELFVDNPELYSEIFNLTVKKYFDTVEKFEKPQSVIVEEIMFELADKLNENEDKHKETEQVSTNS